MSTLIQNIRNGNIKPRQIFYFIAIDIVCSLIITSTFIVVTNYNIAILSIIFTLFFIITTFILYKGKYSTPDTKDANQKFLEKITQTRKRKIITIAIMTIGILIGWLPFLIGSYPYSLTIDTLDQIKQFFQITDWIEITKNELVAINNWHPVLDTIFYGSFYALGDTIFNNPSTGLTILAYLNAIFIATTLAYLIYFIYTTTQKPVLAIISYIFISIIPFIQYYVLGVYKDLSQMSFLILWFILYCKIVLATKNNQKLSYTTYIFWGIISVFAVLTKKTNIYLLMLSSIVLLIYMIIHHHYLLKNRQHTTEIASGNTKNCNCNYKNVKRSINTNWNNTATFKKNATYNLKMTSISMGGCLITFLLVEQLIFPLMGVLPGFSREAFSLPIQQVSSVVVNNSDKISDEEKQIIENVLPYDEIEHEYISVISDPVKRLWKENASKKEILQFLLLWMKWGFVYSDTYVNALVHIQPFFIIAPIETIQSSAFYTTTPLAYIFRNYYYDTYQLPFIDEETLHESFISGMGEDLLAQPVICYQSDNQYSISNNPIFANPFLILLSLMPIYIVWIPVWCCGVILLKDKKNLIMFVPIILSILILVATPGAFQRYAIPILFMTPLIISMPYMIQNLKVMTSEKQ